MCPTRSYSGQHLVQGMVHRRLLIRVERVDGAHQNFERIARKRFFALTRQSQTDCPYRKSNPHVLMVQSTKHRPHFDAPGALDVPPNGRILA